MKNYNSEARTSQTDTLGNLVPLSISSDGMDLLHNPEAERKVVAGTLNSIDAAFAAREVIQPDDIYDTKLRILYAAQQSIVSQNGKLDIVETTEELKRRNQLEILGGSYYISDVFNAVATTVNTEFYARIVQEYSQRRRAIRFLLEKARRVQCLEPLNEILTETSRDAECLLQTRGSDLRDCEIGYKELETIETDEREDIVSGFLRTQSLVMVYAPTGVGKTWVILSLARSIATGETFMGWPVFKRRRVLIVDGEMPLPELRDRAVGLCRGYDLSLLRFLPSSLLTDKKKQRLLLNTENGQARFDALLRYHDENGERPEVLIFDNISSLTDLDENDNHLQSGFLTWLTSLRHRGYTVILVHHAGKSGDQRGASRREDFLDLVMKLIPTDPPSQDGAEFTLTFTKCRGKRPNPFRLNCKLIQDEDGVYTWSTESLKQQDRQRWEECLSVIYNEGISSIDNLCEAMRLKERAVKYHVSKLKKKGYLDGWNVTEKGVAFLNGEPNF